MANLIKQRFSLGDNQVSTSDVCLGDLWDAENPRCVGMPGSYRTWLRDNTPWCSEESLKRWFEELLKLPLPAISRPDHLCFHSMTIRQGLQRHIGQAPEERVRIKKQLARLLRVCRDIQDFRSPTRDSGFYDESKALTLWLQAQQLSLEHPDAQIDVVLIDDKKQILKDVFRFFNAHPSLLPAHVTLHCRLFQAGLCEQAQEDEPVSMVVKGTGDTYYDCMQRARDVCEFCRSNKQYSAYNHIIKVTEELPVFQTHVFRMLICEPDYGLSQLMSCSFVGGEAAGRGRYWSLQFAETKKDEEPIKAPVSCIFC